MNSWIMHLTPPPARKMIEANVPVAVASDYNPNAYCMSMPFVMNVRIDEDDDHDGDGHHDDLIII